MIARLRHLVPFAASLMAAVFVCLTPGPLLGDGLLKASATYEGSLEERSQEAIIIFRMSRIPGEAMEDLILKITVQGETDDFAWIIPFPNKPEVKQADARLFEELFDYVQYRRRERLAEKKNWKGGMGGGAFDDVDVLSREVVGSYDVAVVRENTPGTLNRWLQDEGYQPIQDGRDVIEFYRRKGYVFTCIKVSDARLKAHTPADLHPLRFTFKTGGRDGIYYPMKMTGLQTTPFDVNLYVFFQWWLNDGLNEYGYQHRGFHLKYRDWDTPRCIPNAGKNWANPRRDVFLAPAAGRVPTVAGLLRTLHPNQRYYLTNVRALSLDPAEVRKWKDDLWLFPYYRNPRFVPYDVREDGPASEGYWP